MSILYGNVIDASVRIEGKKGYTFQLTNAVLDPNSREGMLFWDNANYHVLVVHLMRSGPCAKISTQLSLEFGPTQSITLKAQNGSIHVMGFYKPIPAKKFNLQVLEEEDVEDEPQKKPYLNSKPREAQQISLTDACRLKEPPKLQEPQLQIEEVQEIEHKSIEEEENPPVRRSSRRRVPVTTTNTSKTKDRQALKNMANLFNLDAKDLDDQSDQSFQNDNPDASDSDSQRQKESDIELKKEIEQEIKVIKTQGSIEENINSKRHQREMPNKVEEEAIQKTIKKFHQQLMQIPEEGSQEQSIQQMSQKHKQKNQQRTTFPSKPTKNPYI